MSKRSPIVVGLGEALYDCFPTRTVLGGAPVNVVVHAQTLLAQWGGSALPATRVGADELGDRFHDEVQSRGISTDAVQVDTDHPTGQVDVQIDADGDATYQFATDVAWDHLTTSPAWYELAESSAGVVFGTLAQRSPTSRQTIQAFLQRATNAVRLFDVNLREPHFSREILNESLEVATAVKVNQAELQTVASMLNDQSLVDDERQAADWLRDRYELDWVAVTRGPDGVIVYQQDAGVTASGGKFLVEPAPEADTVGAGDACCAALLVGSVLGWPLADTVNAANRLGSFVASVPGATPEMPEELRKAIVPSPATFG